MRPAAVVVDMAVVEGIEEEVAEDLTARSTIKRPPIRY